MIACLVTAGALMAVMTLFFPVEGKTALKLRFVRGIIFGMETAMLVYVLWVKFPVLGWDSVTVPLFTVMAAVSMVMTFRDLFQSAVDFIGQAEGVLLSDVKLVQSTVLRKSSTEYSIQGLREDGRRARIRISQKTFESLREHGDGRPDKFMLVKIYPRTKIFDGVL